MFQDCISGAVAFLVCVSLLPVVRRLAKHWRLYDSPGPLKIHDKQIARIGGVAMMAGLCMPLAFSARPVRDSIVIPLSVFTLVWAIGLADDIGTLPPIVRLSTHLAAGAVFWMMGWRLHWTDNWIADLVATCFFVAFLINAMNLLDGMDGLAAGTTAVVAAGLIPLFSMFDGGHAAALAWSLLGICLAMVAYNYPPARIFMGDSGSTLLGILLAFLFLDWVRIHPDSRSSLAPLLFVSVPVIDAALAILRRLRARTSPFYGDRRHFYDLLLRRGWPVQKVLWASYAATGAVVLIGWLCLLDVVELRLAAPIVITCLLVGGFLLGSLHSGDESLRFRNDIQSRLGPMSTEEPAPARIAGGLR
jgi:UDP-GlcNAc:undecaprenyl-phosphate/decaprenyl-phosphate GlcNAc-1-phosphate transferase